MTTTDPKDDQAEKGRRAGVMMRRLVAIGLVVVQLVLTGKVMAAGQGVELVIGGSLAFLPLLVAVLVWPWHGR